MKLALIIDKSQSYVDFQKDLVAENWEIEPVNVETVASLSEVGETTLFGDTPTAVIHASDINAVKELTSIFESMIKTMSEEEIVNKFEHGLIITTTVARVSTKKLEKIVNDLGGFVVLSKENAKDKTNPVDGLLNPLSIPRDVKRFIQDYAGDNYDMILSVVRTISEIPEKAQRLITIDDILMRIPQAPGAIPPWEIEKSFMNGDIVELISMYRRIVAHSHGLVVVSILKNKIVSSYKISALIDDSREENGTTPSVAEVSTLLGIPNNYPTKLSYESAKKLGFAKLSRVIELFYELEGKLKGGSNVNADVLIELELMRISKLLNA